VSAILTEVDAWITALLLAVLMLAAWGAAWWRGWSLSGKKTPETAVGKFNEAVLAMLGLLLAFTFSMSLVKHEQRRQMAVADSNAIGEFYTSASLLKEPVRGELRALVRRYVERRLRVASSANEANYEQMVQDFPPMHRAMQLLVAKAVDAETPVVEPLVETLNALTSNHAARLAAVRDRLPPSVVLLLLLAAVLSTALLGRQQGVSKEWCLGTTIAFTALVCMVVWVTLDLNQPQSGWITVSQQPLEDLLHNLEAGRPLEASAGTLP
jgi:hypothetical protein